MICLQHSFAGTLLLIAALCVPALAQPELMLKRTIDNAVPGRALNSALDRDLDDFPQALDYNGDGVPEQVSVVMLNNKYPTNLADVLVIIDGANPSRVWELSLATLGVPRQVIDEGKAQLVQFVDLDGRVTRRNPKELLWMWINSSCTQAGREDSIMLFLTGRAGPIHTFECVVLLRVGNIDRDRGQEIVVYDPASSIIEVWGVSPQ